MFATRTAPATLSKLSLRPLQARKMHVQSIPMCTALSSMFPVAKVLTLLGVGSSNNYAYIVKDEETKEGVIIDPANPDE